MPTLTNSPRQTLNFDLERCKSYSFRCNLSHGDGSPVDLTGCTLRFVLKSGNYGDDPFDLLNLLVNSSAELPDPTAGYGVFSFQAAELDQEAGEYSYAIVLWSPDGYSTLLLKGFVNLLDNTESHSMHRMYGVTTQAAALELTLRPNDVVEVQANTLTRGPEGLPGPPGPNSTRMTPTGTVDARGATGDIAVDDSYVYVKTTMGWKRSALSSW